EHHREIPPFSSSERAANRLARRIVREGLTADFEHEDGIWYCFWRKTEDRSLLSSGTGGTRALAICRSILNLDLGRIRPHLSTTPGAMVGNLFSTLARDVFSCPKCGAEISTGRKPRPGRLCNICSWRERAASTGRPSVPTEPRFAS